MRDRPKLTLVPGCGMNLGPTRPRTTLSRVNVRPKLVPGNARQLLKVKNPRNRNLLAPLGDGLGLNPHLPGQLGTGADALENEPEGVGFHGGPPYTVSLQVATAGLPTGAKRGEYHKRMVDSSTEKPRMVPAAPPRLYSDFGQWVSDAVAPFGFGAGLARYCGVTRPGVTKWQNGSVPDDPGMRRKIAEWAGVSYDELRDLIDRHLERVAADKKTSAAAPPKAQANA